MRVVPGSDGAESPPTGRSLIPPPLLEARPASDDAWRATIAGRHPRRDYLLRRLLAVADALGVLGAGALAFAVSPVHDADEMVWLLPLLPLWLLLFRAYGLYEGDVKRIRTRLLDDLAPLFHAFVIGTLLTWLFFRTVPPHELVLGGVVAFAASGVVLVCVLRAVVRRGMTRFLGPERVVLVGQAPLTDAVLGKIQRHPEYGLDPVGIVVTDASRPEAHTVPVLASLQGLDLESLIHQHAFERLMVVQSDISDEAMLDLVQQCGALSVKASILPRHVNAMGPSLQVDDVEGITVFNLNPLVLSRSSRMLKRSMDLVCASLGLLLLSPLLAIVAVAIKRDSEGPVLFRQRRMGRRGRPFEVLKFRTMDVDAEYQVPALRRLSMDPNWLRLEHDPRITKVGRMLRLTSIDELPQLWNVLRGEMSLVGPRPLPIPEDERIAGWGRIRLDLAPGITGLWQVLGRAAIPFEEMVKLDFVYVSNWSLWQDLQLVLRTIPIAFRRRGAN
jgi:exopolysaccharide biosynthesis polyprenyl glycosylphosphotransferase